MIDPAKDRRRHARRGSLLDHAGDAHSDSLAPSMAQETAISRDHEPLPRRPAPSLLNTPARTARLSTAGYATGDKAAAGPLQAPAGAAPAPAQDRPETHRSSDERFGDRIARLIGVVSSGDTRAASPAASGEPASLQGADDTSWHGLSRRSQPLREACADDDAVAASAPRRRDQTRDDHFHWHAASSGDRGDDGLRPLLDASILISAVVRYWKQILAAAFIGALLGVMLALSTPHRYYAESRLFIDPREVRVTEDDIRNQQLSTEAMLAITDSQLQILSSTSVLQKVVADLGLERDPEFNGSLSSGGISGGLTLIKELFTGAGGPSDAEQTALEELRDSLSVSRDANTFVIIVGISSRDPEKSALIANQIVETYLDSEGQAQSSLLERTSESIDTRINALRADLDAAEREVERFKAENGLVGVGGQYIDDNVILALSDQLANARAMKVGIRIKANNLAKVNIGDVLSGALPEELLSSNLIDLRKQYTETRSNAESLATSLGPRHPRYIAAKSSMDTIEKEISAELRRIVASSQTELQRAVETEQELASQMAVAKSRAMDQSVEFVTLRELERKAAATRGIYEAFLTRSRETSERSNFTTRNVRVISPAEAPLQPMGPSRKLIAIGGLFAGFFAGIGLALMVGAVESFRAYNSGPAQARLQTPPFGHYPATPDPGPRTPPSGPGRTRWTRRDEDAGTTAFDRAADQATAEAFAAPRAEVEAEPVAPAPAPVRRETAPVQRETASDTGYQSPPPQSSPPAPLPQMTTGFSPAAPDRGFEPGHMPNPRAHVPGPQAEPGFAAEHLAPGFVPAAQQPGWAHHSWLDPHPSAGHTAAAYPGVYSPQAPEPRNHDPRAPEFRSHDPRLRDPRLIQPLWTAPTAQSQVQPQHYPFHPSQPAPVADTYAAYHQASPLGHQAGQHGYPVPQTGYGAPHPLAQPHPAPVWQPAAPAMHHPAAVHYPAAPHQPTPAPAENLSQPYPQPARQSARKPSMGSPPLRNEAVDRIRRDMDVLRSRIDDYGASRRHG